MTVRLMKMDLYWSFSSMEKNSLIKMKIRKKIAKIKKEITITLHIFSLVFYIVFKFIRIKLRL